MTQDLVLYETEAKVGFVTLNRPEKLNALSTDLRREQKWRKAQFEI